MFEGFDIGNQIRWNLAVLLLRRGHRRLRYRARVLMHLAVRRRRGTTGEGTSMSTDAVAVSGSTRTCAGDLFADLRGPDVTGPGCTGGPLLSHGRPFR